MALVTHGGRVLTIAREHAVDYRDLLDFSANINPLGPSPKAVEAIQQAIDRIGVYPEETSAGLNRALSERLRVPAGSILTGNGATELLYFWLRSVRPRSAALVVPTFGEYRRALESVGAEIRTIRLEADRQFRLPFGAVDADVVIVTNPNNPTGAYMPPEEMLQWIKSVQPSTHVFLDEAFVEFTAQPSLVRHAVRCPNLWVLRSMTKFYALPGLRLGYLVGSGVPSLTEKREPWQVNTLAEVAGIASLQDRDYEEATLQLIQRERIWLWKQLQGLPGIHTFPTAANFFLACCRTDQTLDRLIGISMEKNILVRDCRTIEGLDGPYFRFAIRTRSDNERLLECLETCNAGPARNEHPCCY
jgi:threonine-phosphate decarboxylase